MIVRIGDYELQPYNANCYQLYNVMPDGYETKAKCKRADDGRVLIAIDKYPSTIAAGIRIIARRIENEGARVETLEQAAERIEGIYRQISDLADRIGEKSEDRCL